MFVISRSMAYARTQGYVEEPNYYTQQIQFDQVFATRMQAERFLEERAKFQADRYRGRAHYCYSTGNYVNRSYAEIIDYFLRDYQVRPATNGEVERYIFETGNAERPIWFNTPWHQNAHCNFEDIQAHFARKDDDRPGMVGFYDGVAHLERGRLTWSRPGRYLKKFFGDTLTAEQIEFWATYFTTGVKPVIQLDAALAFAWTPKGIASVYNDGPRSCMSGNHFSISGSPTRVYGAGDLAVVYLEMNEWPAAWGERDFDGKIIARALVRPETKTYGRIYPSTEYWRADGFDCSTTSQEVRELLERQLRDLGYTSLQENRTGFDGAKIIKESDGGDTVVMPYLDNCMRFNNCGDHLELDADGEYSSESTGGYAEMEREYAWTCDRCDDGQEDHDDSTDVVTRFRNGVPWTTESWCEHCADHSSFRCEGLDQYVADSASDQYEMSNGETWCYEHFASHGVTCDETGENLAMDDATCLHDGDYVCSEWASENCVEIDGDWYRNSETFTCLYDGSVWTKDDESSLFPGWPAEWDDNDTLSLQDRCAYGSPGCEATVWASVHADTAVSGLEQVASWLENMALETGYCLAA